MGTAGQLSFTFFRLQRTGPGSRAVMVGSRAGAFQATLSPLSPFGDRIVPFISSPALRTV